MPEAVGRESSGRSVGDPLPKEDLSPFPVPWRWLKFRARTSDREATPMKTFFWGILTGTVVAWLYANEGSRFHHVVDGLFQLRDTARLSVCGYGGRH